MFEVHRRPRLVSLSKTQPISITNKDQALRKQETMPHASIYSIKNIPHPDRLKSVQISPRAAEVFRL